MKIARIEIHPVEYPTLRYFKFFGARPVRPAILVKLVAENGVHGWGQCLPIVSWSFESPAASRIVLRDHFAPAVLGCDALDLDGLQRALDRALAPSFSTPMPITRAAIDLAAHDLFGKLTGQSLAQLWGRPPGGPVQLSWTVNVPDLEQADAEVAAGRGRGFRHFNIKLGTTPDFDVALAGRVRALAPEGFLWADANCGYDVATALEVLPRLADAGVDVLESPLPANRLSGYQALKRQGALPIFMDEGVISPVDVDEFLRLDLFDGLAIKISRVGGLEPARRQIERVLAAGKRWLGSGLSDPDVSYAASAALYSIYGLAQPAALNGRQFVGRDLSVRPLELQGDLLQPPVGPGLGVDLDPAQLPSLYPCTTPAAPAAYDVLES